MRLIRWIILSLALTFGVSGCAAFVVGAAAGAAGTVYVLGKLQEDISQPVPTVHHAAIAGIKDLELPLLEDKGDKLTARLESEFADGTHVWIHIGSTGESRARLTIRVGVMGDEVRSRQILAAIKKYLA